MAVKNGLPDTDFSEMNRNYILQVMEGETVIDGKPATDFSRMNRKYIEAVAEENAVDIEAKTITENGTYTAEEGKAFSPVTVNVAGGGIASDIFKIAATVTLNVSGLAENQSKVFSEAAYDALCKESDTPGYYIVVAANGNSYKLKNGTNTAYLFAVGPAEDFPGSIYYDATRWTVTVTSGDAIVVEEGPDTFIVITGDCVLSVVYGS